MSKKSRIVIMLIIAILVGIVIYLSVDMLNMTKSKTTSKDLNTILTNNTVTNNSIKNNIVNEEINNVIENEINNTVVEDENTEIKLENANSDEEKAIILVKANWGEDDTVYFSNDGKNSDGKYVICVRDKSTTKALAYYEVDVEDESFTIR